MVTGQARGLTLGLVGWLWADLLLGLFAIFLAANSAGAVLQVPNRGIDPTAVAISLAIDGDALLSADTAKVRAEQDRIAAEVAKQVTANAGDRKVALVLAFATHASAAEGDRLAKVATDGLTSGSFSGSVIKTYHELSPGDSGRKLSLEIYLYY